MRHVQCLRNVGVMVFEIDGNFILSLFNKINSHCVVNFAAAH